MDKGTTSKLQPLDLGIICAFKARYRKHMLKHLITKIDLCSDNVSLTKGITVLEGDKGQHDNKLFSNCWIPCSSNNKTLNARLLARVITGCHYT